MIRRGRVEGWLKRSVDALPAWAEFNGIKFNGIRVGPMPGFEHRGSTVIATRDLDGVNEDALMVIPKDLVLSRQNVEFAAKSDTHLRQVLEAAGVFARTSRGAILIFLLMQATIACPDIKDIGVHTPLTEYIKFLPDELLPTFWTEEEQELLEGTTLRVALRAKMNSLLREFEAFRAATENIAWCAKYWWSEEGGYLDFDDWMRIDAMYRSRALEFPGVGDCMVPGVDMANHASGNFTAAHYESDENGDGVLLLREDRKVARDGEITITYGDDKGACENIFSYGFTESTMVAAKVMFLEIELPDDDPLAPAKRAVNTAAPGFRLYEKNDRIEWESDFVWLIAVNEEDGLDFKVKQTIDGHREIQAFWKQCELDDTSKLRSHLQLEPLWDIYQLRVVVLIQGAIDSRLHRLRTLGEPARTKSVRQGPWELAAQLRSLESDMLEQALIHLEDQKAAIFQSDTVRKYLGLDEESTEGEEEIDFS
ncbi:SET domain-containing protein [Polyplosphaeria fusca]|uniref:SET domain-containing protein n=1 Tax=Polyplosphaeria fusca TaxID=682080 RepID=A0A9P4V945_9PLEO|nr:SET domain-containing protein [Polyplosphaeria fusca]